MENMIKLPKDIDLKKFAQRVYEFSNVQGLGFIHAQPGGLSDEDAKSIVERERADGSVALYMDYVHGRACKMTVRRENGELFVRKDWYDHSFKQYALLLAEFGVIIEQEITVKDAV